MKSVLSYLIVLISAIGYMILFDRSAGGIMTVFLIVVPVISVFLTLISRRKIGFDLIISNITVKKKNPEVISVEVRKNTILPVPIISFELGVSERISPLKYEEYRFSMSDNRKISIDVDIFPEICGVADITIRKMYISDYLGVFKFKINCEEITKNIHILPEIYEPEESSEILRSIYSTLPDNDEDDDAQPVIGKTSFPGYEYRAYIPGDSLKKVNWKLSSKRNEMFVRLDECSGMTRPDIILDTTKNNFENSNPRYSMILKEKITEAALSTLLMCVKHGIECTFSYMDNGVMVKENVSGIDDIEAIAVKTAGINFSEDRITINSGTSSKSSEVSIIYTHSISEDIISSSENAVLYGNSMKAVLPEERIDDQSCVLTDLWSVGDDRVIRRVC